ncbi:GNAT family N-acetyltransferase [Sodalis sp. dw_96]|uniref:GNAT family N-acetyltransferase n=1 Tax=Sodalis sp. dw_96 TaxID=2719794 RepID=UPI001BD41515|nr:GNAT family N-acetyltransferase [Sodalis sp. dw_96]
MAIFYTDKLITAMEYNELRSSVGWSEPNHRRSEQALEHSLYICSAYQDQRIVGSGRVVGDGSLIFCIMDLMVHPDFQHRYGIGVHILHNIFHYLKENACPEADILGMAAVGRERFYEKMGFVIRPTNSLGAGMNMPYAELLKY